MYSIANPSVLLVVSEPAMNRSRHNATNCSSAHQSVYEVWVHKHTLIQENIELLLYLVPICKLLLKTSNNVQN
jgi:hypothetical protein